jgi:ATP-binding cassette subfamily B (MDR/TAP) protein 1
VLLQVGQRASIIQGMSLGSMQFVMFCSYAIALFYGAHRIAAGAYTGGDVLNVMMCCLMGSFSVGMVRTCCVLYVGRMEHVGA